MNIPHVLAQVIRRSSSLSYILDATVEVVAREMGTDVCSIYLLDPTERRLRMAATHGLKKEALGTVSLAAGEGITGIVVEEMRAITADEPHKHPGYRYFPETGEEAFHSYLGVPMAIRNRPVGAIVVQTREPRKFTTDEMETLHTISAQLVGVVENARLINALDQPEGADRYLRDLREWNQGLRLSEKAGEAGEITFSGNPASEGYALGKAIYRGGYHVDVESELRLPRDPVKEKDRLAVALDKTRADVLRIQEAAEKETDEEHAIIFTSHLLLLSDPIVQDRLDRAIETCGRAAIAVDQVFAGMEDQIGNVSDAYLQERVEDIHDLRNRILSYLLESPVRPRSVAKSIVVAQGISPSLVVELKVQGALGVVTERGGATSHGALLARAMGIPTVTGVEGFIEAVHTGDEAIVDGTSGVVILRPSARTTVRYRRRAEDFATRRSDLEQLRDKPPKSKDGVTLTLLANVSLASEIRQAVLYGAEGVGLYRTEFPFIIREDFPTREEQVNIYRRAVSSFPKGPMNFRILDVGGDKHHPRISRPDETNPVLGYRSIRLMLDHPRILKEQIQAFVLVGGERQIGILVPMVATVEELRKTKSLIAEAIDELDVDSINRSPYIGAMIEVPAAVEIALELAREVDFMSIGSNDLIQFTLAADRENSRVAPFGDPYHPAILRMIRRTIVAAHDADIPVGCCGEIGADPALAVLLMAMGIDNISLTPGAIPAVKEAIRNSNIETIRQRTGEILGLAEPDAIRETLHGIVKGQPT